MVTGRQGQCDLWGNLTKPRRARRSWRNCEVKAMKKISWKQNSYYWHRSKLAILSYVTNLIITLFRVTDYRLGRDPSGPIWELSTLLIKLIRRLYSARQEISSLLQNHKVHQQAYKITPLEFSSQHHKLIILDITLFTHLCPASDVFFRFSNKNLCISCFLHACSMACPSLPYFTDSPTSQHHQWTHNIVN